jgi:hypothetical protein
MKAAPITLAALAMAVGLTGCVALGLSPAPLQADAVQALIHRPDFAAAAKASPTWVKAALDTVNAQQLRLDTAKP